MKGQVEGQLTLFQEGFLASPFPRPGSAEARRTTATSGRKWSELSKNSGPLGLLERMLLGSSEWRSPIFYLSWKPVDIGQGRFLYQLAPSEPDTGVTGWQSLATGTEPNLSGQVKLWPTPTAQDYKRRGPNSRQQGLPERVVKMYSTPTAQDAKNSTLPPSQARRKSLVGDIAREKFATPQARDWKRRNRNLDDRIAMYPTPTTGAGLCGGTGNYQQLKKLETEGKIMEEERKNMSRGNGGSLNPEWVEWLMGFPVGWTDIGT